MGRTQKFSDDLLLDAVIQYADIEKNKIKASKLAKWARINIAGLEEVQDYHFTRPSKNPVTGKLEKKLCTLRLEEINSIRDTRQLENRNVLTSNLNVDSFFVMDDREQRKEIMEMREIFFQYRRDNKRLRQRECDSRALVSNMTEKVEAYRASFEKLKKQVVLLEKQVTYIKRVTEEDRIRAYMDRIGISSGDFGDQKYRDAIRENISDLENIDAEIKKYQRLFNNIYDDESDKGTGDGASRESSEEESVINIDDDLTDF